MLQKYFNSANPQMWALIQFSDNPHEGFTQCKTSCWKLFSRLLLSDSHDTPKNKHSIANIVLQFELGTKIGRWVRMRDSLLLFASCSGPHERLCCKASHSCNCVGPVACILNPLSAINFSTRAVNKGYIDKQNIYLWLRITNLLFTADRHSHSNLSWEWLLKARLVHEY